VSSTTPDQPRATVEHPHPVTREPVAFRFADGPGHDAWSVLRSGQSVGVVVRPYSVVDDAPPTYVALPPGATGLMAGLWAGSWAEALAHLEAASTGAREPRTT
jgi:hypothetical protein